jgi:hypothetical protein
VAGCCEYSAELVGSGATELVSLNNRKVCKQVICLLSLHYVPILYQLLCLTTVNYIPWFLWLLACIPKMKVGLLNHQSVCQSVSPPQ